MSGAGESHLFQQMNGRETTVGVVGRDRGQEAVRDNCLLVYMSNVAETNWPSGLDLSVS